MVTPRFEPALDAAGQSAASSSETRAVAVYHGAPAAAPRTLWQILKATAEAFPEAIAIDDGRSVLSYLALLWKVRRVGGRLAFMGVGAGDRVGIRLTSGRA